MALDDKDLKKIGDLMDKQSKEILGVMDQKMEAQSKEILGVMDQKMEAQSKEILSVMDRKIDDKLLDFHEKVTEPMIDSVVEDLKNDIKRVENNTYRIERKLDNVLDMLTIKVVDHEKRITKLEKVLI